MVKGGGASQGRSQHPSIPLSAFPCLLGPHPNVVRKTNALCTKKPPVLSQNVPPPPHAKRDHKKPQHALKKKPRGDLGTIWVVVGVFFWYILEGFSGMGFFLYNAGGFKCTSRVFFSTLHLLFVRRFLGVLFSRSKWGVGAQVVCCTWCALRSAQ